MANSHLQYSLHDPFLLFPLPSPFALLLHSCFPHPKPHLHSLRGWYGVRGKGDLLRAPRITWEKGVGSESVPLLWRQVPSHWPHRLLMLIFSSRALKVNLDLTSLLDNEDKKSKNKRGVLPKHATNIMRSWLFQHLMVSVCVWVCVHECASVCVLGACNHSRE